MHSLQILLLLLYVTFTTGGSHNFEAAERLKQELKRAEAPPTLVEKNNTTVVTSLGQTVYLYCGVHNLGERAIVNPNMDDSGLYECQVSYHDDTEKKLKMPFSLKVLESRAYIVGSHDLYMKEASEGASVINYSSMEGIEVSLATEENQAISTLTIKSASLDDSGNYTCAPANALPDSLILNVIKGGSIQCSVWPVSPCSENTDGRKSVCLGCEIPLE